MTSCPSYSKEPSAHQRPHFHTPRGAQGHNGRCEPKLKTQRKGHPAKTAPPGALPGEPSAPLSRCETHHQESTAGAPFRLGEEGGAVYGAPDTLQDSEEGHYGTSQDLL